MTQMDSSTLNPLGRSLTHRMIIGAGIGLLLISVFVIPAEADRAWGKFWMVRPLIVTPFAGAMAGMFNYLILNFHEFIGMNRKVAIIASVIMPLIGLYLGLVLGLDGTMWD